MAHARAALVGLPLGDGGRGQPPGVGVAEYEGNLRLELEVMRQRAAGGDGAADMRGQQLWAEADGSLRGAAMQRERETSARIELVSQEAARARAVAEEAKRAAEMEAQRSEATAKGAQATPGGEAEKVKGATGMVDGSEAALTVLPRRVHALYREYTYEEIELATDGFAPERKLGEGGFGTVYSGTLHHTPVAVKVLKSTDAMQAKCEFLQEVEVLGQIQHPHVLMLLGCCPDRYILVYEFLANGSLEDRLLCLNNTPPLPWYIRIRVAAEIASALLILHTRPVPIVHRDLKPGNILLDKNFVAKLGDVGLAKLMPGLSMERTYMRESVPVGTFAYVDPEFQKTGEFGPKSDVYALGIVLLDLLTGRTPAVYELMEEAVETNRNDVLLRFLDRRAGTWPAGMPMDVARLAVRCSEMKRRKRPELETEVMPILDRMRGIALKAEEEAKKASVKQAVSVVPPSLLCPITQEMMVNPVIAADGHTYELVAIQQWLEKSDRSPMTNVKLPHRELVPNHAVRSMIMDWREQNGR
eukprot:TRINITY_DN13434_c0_g2_i1.p1 TRINITY_DN13434_c0_g2~~TRINITY_DN13434_c0_g2_i1.p1  ORF type:complete len:544 (-),score=35.39 TRINITY_DN13434_c0_g2_i1:295-1881(-)